MGIRKGLKRYLLEKGFCRERGGKTFFRLLVDDFYVCVELHYERRPAYQIVPNHWLEIKAPFYDLKFDVLCLNERCMEGLNLSLLYMTRKKNLSDVGCLSSLCSVCGKQKQDWIKHQEIDEMRIPDGNEEPFDLMLSVDVSDIRRLGCCDQLIQISRHTAQIDHHPTNPLFMEENSVDGEAPAACILIREQIAALGIEIDRDMAICLYTGISTDTGNFAFASTNAECFEIMSELMGKDLPLAKLNRILFRERAKPQVLLMGRALNSLQYYENGQIAVMKLTWRDFEECEALSEHADTLVNFGLDTV